MLRSGVTSQSSIRGSLFFKSDFSGKSTNNQMNMSENLIQAD
jgi:hypothetical protein